jgi:long-chain acyl-CoA synthetase
MTNLADVLVETARMYPDRPAVRQDDTVITYRELDAHTAALAGWAACHGVAPGDRVAVMLPNVTDFAVIYYGLLRAGAVVVPMNPLLRGREVAHYLTDSGAKLIFAWHEAFGAEDGAATAGARHVAVGPGHFEFDALTCEGRLVQREPDDTAVILYTSGTTGLPKGAELTHENLRRNAVLSATELLALEPDDVVMGCLPMFHTFGQTCALNAVLVSGASVTLVPRFDPHRALDIAARDRVTVFAGVPTMYVALTGVADATKTTLLRRCISGGAALPVEVLNAFEAAYGVPIMEGYGLSETSPVASFNLPDARRPGSIGVPIAGVEMRIIDPSGAEVPVGEVGEIAIRGHNVMKSYWHQPDATTAAIVDGWFRTGDLGRVDEDGFFYVVDRKKDMIIRGGYNVYPREIEEVLYEHPQVVEAAVIGIPHPTHGEEVAAAVVVDGDVTEEEIREFVKTRVAAYKYPRRVWFVDALPKGPTGKILKREITIPEERKS